MKKFFSSLIALSFFALSVAPASAAVTVSPWTYDPDGTNTVVSQWVTTPPDNALDKELCKNGGWKTDPFTSTTGTTMTYKNQGQCISGANKWNEEHSTTVLSLQKNAPTATNSAAGATVLGAENTTLTSLGFDYSGYCGAGSPRFNVYTTAGTYYFFGCSYGTHTDLGNGWTNVTFSNADAYPADGVTAFPGFGSTTVTGIEIVQDEQGQVQLDNIMVNGTVVGS
jgi:hypothetical protein